MPSKRIWTILVYSHSERAMLALPEIKSRKSRAKLFFELIMGSQEIMRNTALWETSIAQDEKKR